MPALEGFQMALFYLKMHTSENQCCIHITKMIFSPQIYCLECAWLNFMIKGNIRRHYTCGRTGRNEEGIEMGEENV